MKTYEKIDLLMKITDTSNIVLGRYLNFDASYISRIRSGKRNLPKSSSFMELVSAFFADRINDDYRKKVVGELASPGKEWPEDPRAGSELIYGWLSMPEHGGTPIENILTGISSMKSASIPSVNMPESASSQSSEDVQCFYGNGGKREAVSLFLSELGQMEHPPRLLLYSNEEFDWMYEDREFAKKWAALLLTYINKGGRIRIAHTVSRASGEMLVALQKWIPMYMTGAIEPYYYPKIMDRVFRRTMFIAEGHSAIVAGSVGERTEGALNILIKDREAVRSLENGYRDFLDLCKPLMQIYDIRRRDAFFDELKQFYKAPGSTMTARTTPSFFTMPEEVASMMNRRLDSSWMMKRQKAGEEVFRKMMEEGDTLMEILNLPDADSIGDGIPFPMCDLFDRPGLSYTCEEFRVHLENVVRLLKENENYHVILSSAIPANEMIYVKEDATAIVVRSDTPSIAFVLKEQRMVAALWDYLNGLGEGSPVKEGTIRRLEMLIEGL